jgi:hypothetical protein
MTNTNRFIFNSKTGIFLLFFTVTFALTGCGDFDEKSNFADLAAAFQVLDKVHEAFNQKDTSAMYQHFTRSTEFFGTDSSENWDLEGFKAYMANYIASPNPGPNYKVKWRKLAPSSDSKVLWGVEELDYPSLKMPVRSTVVLENIQGKWKVQMQQWHFLIKNEKVNEVDQLH